MFPDLGIKKQKLLQKCEFGWKKFKFDKNI